MTTLRIEIDTNDRLLERDLLGERELYAAGQHVEVPGLAPDAVTYEGTTGRKALGEPETIMLAVVLPIVTTTIGNLLSTWICSKLQGRVREVRINRRIVELNEGEISRVIDESEEQHR